MPSSEAEHSILHGKRAHSVVWMLHDDWIEGVVTCHTAEGGDCRMLCPEGCESWSLTDHEHTLVDSGKCNFVEWMEASDGVLAAHVGSHAPVNGFIEPEFDDDHFNWSYSFPHLTNCTYHGHCPQPKVCDTGCRGPEGAVPGV